MELSSVQHAETATAVSVAGAVGVPTFLAWYAAVGVVAGWAGEVHDGLGAAVAGAGVWLAGPVSWELTRRSFLHWFPKMMLALTPLR